MKQPVTSRMSSPGKPEPEKPKATHTLKKDSLVKKFVEYCNNLDDGIRFFGGVVWAYLMAPAVVLLIAMIVIILAPGTACSSSSHLNPQPAFSNWDSNSADTRAFAGESQTEYDKRMAAQHEKKPDSSIISAPVDTRVLGWMATACAGLSIVALVASFTPFGATIPRGLAAGLAVGGVGAWALQYTLNVYGKPLFVAVAICTGVTVLACGVIFAVAAIRWSMRRAGINGLHEQTPVLEGTARDWVFALAASDNRVAKIRSELADALDKFLAKSENADRALGLLKSVGISPPKWLV